MSLVLDPNQTRDALNDALEYLDDCDIFVPDFRHRIVEEIGGSYVNTEGKKAFMRLGCYVTRPLADWFVMHELMHVLFAAYDPTRRRKFRGVFGDPMPDDYDDQQWKTRFPRFVRPDGYASYYARDGGGEERFAELVAFMYTREGAFDSRPPADLRRTWRVAWDEGLARMVESKLV